MTRFQFLTAALVTCAMQGPLPSAMADEYPTKPIRYVAPFAPGGATDLVARLLGERLGQKLGQPVFVENKAGASGLIGTRQVAQAAGDGYTMVGITFNYLVFPVMFKELGFDMAKDLAPVTQIVTLPSVLLVPVTSKITSVSELVAEAKRRPGTIKFASSGVGTASHIAGELLKREARIEIDHVPYRGGGPANVDLIAGHVSMHFANIGSAIEYVRAGRLRALAVATNERIPSLPDVPTMKECGFPNFQINEIQGILMPGKTPAAIVDKVSKELVTILRDPEMVKKFEAMGGQVVASTPEEFASFLKTSMLRWSEVARASGIVAE